MTPTITGPGLYRRADGKVVFLAPRRDGNWLSIHARSGERLGCYRSDGLKRDWHGQNAERFRIVTRLPTPEDEEPVREVQVGDIYEDTDDGHRWWFIAFDDEGDPVAINRFCEDCGWYIKSLEGLRHLAHTTDLHEAMAWLRGDR